MCNFQTLEHLSTSLEVAHLLPQRAPSVEHLDHQDQIPAHLPPELLLLDHPLLDHLVHLDRAGHLLHLLHRDHLLHPVHQDQWELLVLLVPLVHLVQLGLLHRRSPHQSPHP